MYFFQKNQKNCQIIEQYIYWQAIKSCVFSTSVSSFIDNNLPLLNGYNVKTTSTVVIKGTYMCILVFTYLSCSLLTQIRPNTDSCLHLDSCLGNMVLFLNTLSLILRKAFLINQYIEFCCSKI